MRVPKYSGIMAERICDLWNETNPIGTEVEYESISNSGDKQKVKTRSLAWVASFMPLVAIEGVAGGVSIDHITGWNEPTKKVKAADRRKKNAAALVVALVAMLLINAFQPAQARTTGTMVDMPYWLQVLKVGEFHIDDKTHHIWLVMCFLDENGRRLVYQDLTTEEFVVMSSKRFCKRASFMGLAQSGEMTVWTGFHQRHRSN